MKNQIITSSRKVGMRDINALLQSAPISRITTLRDDDGRKGFTLIEVLVVVLIIGILSAVALPQYQKAVLKSRLGSLFHLVNTVHQAEQEYYLANGMYTNQIDDLSVGLLQAEKTTSPGGNTWLTWNSGQYRVAIERTLVAGSVMSDEKYIFQYQKDHNGKSTRCIAFDELSNTICAGLGQKSENECRAGDTKQTCTVYIMSK